MAPVRTDFFKAWDFFIGIFAIDYLKISQRSLGCVSCCRGTIAKIGTHTHTSIYIIKYKYRHLYIYIYIENSHFSTVFDGPNPGSFEMVPILYTITDGVSRGTTAVAFCPFTV